MDKENVVHLHKGLLHSRKIYILCFIDRGVQPIIFCFEGVPPSGKSLPINLAGALH